MIYIKMLQVKKFPLFDCFFDEGWLNWSRVYFKHNKVKVIAGGNRPTSELKIISKFIGNKLKNHEHRIVKNIT